ncbi:MAG: glycosyl transferase family protein [uncultured bacterium]|nr:MAG: glycosyl transferase family protein [uncultured bacterium]
MIISCIIVTKDRPDDCQRCLASLRAQSRVPDQIIVVEGGKAQLADKTGIKLIFSVPGITKQRNVARRQVRSDCDVVVYLDDDTVLSNDVLSKVEQDFIEHTKMIGLTGKISGEAPHYDAKKFFGKLLGLYTSQPYGISWGLFNIINTVTQTQPVQWLPGAFMCYRWSAVREIIFDEWFSEYGLGEDFDYSLRVATVGELWADPNIKVEHWHSAVGRNWQKFGYMRIVNRCYLYNKFFRGKYWLWFGMWWANGWLIIINAWRGLISDRYMAEWYGEIRALLHLK